MQLQTANLSYIFEEKIVSVTANKYGMMTIIVRKAFPYKVYSMEKTQKSIKGEQPILHAKHRPDWTYMYTNLHQNISNGIRVMELWSAQAVHS